MRPSAKTRGHLPLVLVYELRRAVPSSRRIQSGWKKVEIVLIQSIAHFFFHDVAGLSPTSQVGRPPPRTVPSRFLYTIRINLSPGPTLSWSGQFRKMLFAWFRWWGKERGNDCRSSFKLVLLWRSQVYISCVLIWFVEIQIQCRFSRTICSACSSFSSCQYLFVLA